jgi:hypothetical protein
MSVGNRQDERDGAPNTMAGPWGAPPPGPIEQRPAWSAYLFRNKLSVLLFVVICLSVGIRMYRDLSGPDAWAYWRDQYVSPSMSSSLTTIADLDGSGHRVPALTVRGRIGAAAASWFRERIDEAHLKPGDLVLLSSPGGDLGQAIIMGEVIRSRGLSTAVGTVDDSGQIASGHVARSYCASACVLVFAGGKTRFGVDGSKLGVHRFVTTGRADDPVADAQRTTGAVLSYFARMGVSSAVVEAMSATSDIRWLSAKEATAMKLITDPAGNS